MKGYITKAVLFCSIISLSFAFVGCAKKDQTPTQQATTNERIELVFYNLFDNQDAFAGQIQAFQSQYPNIRIRYEKFSNPEEYEKSLINEIAEGKGPDIMAMHNTWFLKHKNKLSPMPVDLPVPMNAPKYRQTFFDVAATDLIFDEQIYGIPLSVDTLGLYYNKEYLASAISGTNRPGDTWDKIKKQVIALTKKDKSKERFAVTGIAMGRSDNITQAIDILYLLMMEYETKLYGQDGRANFAQPQGTIEGTGKPYYPGVLALELFTSFGLPSYNNYSWNDAITGASPEEKEINTFVRGKTAMIFGYSYLYDEIKRSINNQQKLQKKHIELVNVKVSEVPQVLDPSTTNKRFAFASYFPLTVSKNSQHPKEAWLFIQFLSSKDSLQTYFEKTHKPTSRYDMQEEQALDPIYGAFARQAQYAKSYKVLDDNFFNSIFTDAIDDVLDTESVSKSLKNAEQKVNCFIDKSSGKPQFRNIDCLSE